MVTIYRFEGVTYKTYKYNNSKFSRVLLDIGIIDGSSNWHYSWLVGSMKKWNVFGIAKIILISSIYCKNLYKFVVTL